MLRIKQLLSETFFFQTIILKIISVWILGWDDLIKPDLTEHERETQNNFI